MASHSVGGRHLYRDTVGVLTGCRFLSVEGALSAEVAVVHTPGIPSLNSATGRRLDGDCADSVGQSKHGLVRARLVAGRVGNGPAPGISVVASCASERLCRGCCESDAP